MAVYFEARSVFLVHPNATTSRISAAKASRMIDAGTASVVGRNRVAILRRDDIVDYGYELKGRQSGQYGPTVIQRVPMNKKGRSDGEPARRESD